MDSFRSLHSRLLRPLLALAIVSVLSGAVGVYWLANTTLHDDLQKRGQLLSTALVISAETSSSLSDFQRALLATAADPSIENIHLLDPDYHAIFHSQSAHTDNELKELEAFAHKAKKTE